ncbi:hypothetical protein LUZ60_003269 [Juncus effusus]|nr:hypothetical protein LUZ60_003269 [Juncus effusus]
MLLLVHIIEARNLLSMDSNGFSDPFVILQLGSQKKKTKVISMNLNPVWDEKFSFEVRNLKDELRVHVYDEDRIGKDFLGKVKVPIGDLMNDESMSLGTKWYKLEPKSEKSKNKECGEICMSISINRELRHAISDPFPAPQTPTRLTKQLSSLSTVSTEIDSIITEHQPFFPSERTEIEENQIILEEEEEEKFIEPSPPPIINNLEEKSNNEPTIAGMLRNIFTGKTPEISQITELPATPLSELPKTPLREFPLTEITENGSDDSNFAPNSSQNFDELLKSFESKHQEAEIPPNLPGGILIDKYYLISPSELNSLIFSPDSDFPQSFSEVQNLSNFQSEPWKVENDGEALKRIVSYMMPPSGLVKSVQATEEQIYLKCSENSFCVLSSVSTPDVPAVGSYFKTEILFIIKPGPDLQTEEKSTRLTVSWRINFLQNTIFKGKIESGARQGLKETYTKFADVLCQRVKIADVNESGSDKESLLADLQVERDSFWKLILLYFGNFTVVSYILGVFLVILHLLVCSKGVRTGFEFNGFDLPDSICEVVIGGVLVLQGQRVLNKISRFVQARQQQGGDHGVKAQGDGWLLTVALIEGNKLAAVDSTGSSDPYVVFTCNGKTKTSSIKFQTLEPQWNEIFEFDAMSDPPSVMRIDVYDFDGPFDEVTSLGYAEVNFVKSNLQDLSDIWLPLHGNLAKTRESKLRLRIFLSNSKGSEMVSEYIKKMENEVGHKIALRSPQAHSEFQKLFHLPAEEFLINDLSCQLKRKLPLQGRLFLSPRIIAFYSNLFGRKTRFYFLWEDIEDIRVISPNLGTQSLYIILHKGKGMDAKHGAKSTENGKLKFHFQNFVSFNVAKRTIIALWKARSLTLEQKVRIAAEESGDGTGDSGNFIGFADAQKSEVFSSILPFDMNSVMEAFEGEKLEKRVMSGVGCLNYSSSEWESVRTDAYQRHTHYKFAKDLSPNGGEVTSTQQKTLLGEGRKGWVIDEVIELQGVLLGDFYNIHVRYQIEDLSPKQKGCNVQVSLGVAWLKSTKHQKRVTKNVISNSSTQIHKFFSQIEKELTPPM